MNSDAIQSKGIASRKQCLIASSNNSNAKTKFSKITSKLKEKIIIKAQKILSQNKQKTLLIKSLKISESPNARKKKTRLKVRKNKDSDASSTKFDCEGKQKNKNLNMRKNKRINPQITNQPESVSNKGSTGIIHKEKKFRLAHRNNNTLDFDLLLKRLFPSRLRMILEEDAALKKELKREKSQLNNLINKQRKDTNLTKNSRSPSVLKLKISKVLKQKRKKAKLGLTLKAKKNIKLRVNQSNKTPNSKGIYSLSKISFLDFKNKKPASKPKNPKVSFNNNSTKFTKKKEPKRTQTLKNKKTAQKPALDPLSECRISPVKNGFLNLSAEEYGKNKMFFTNKKRKRTQNDSESGKNCDFICNNNNTISNAKNGNNTSSEGRSKKNKFGKSPKKDSNIYDINNFVVQNFSSKIVPKKEIFKIPTPIFQELSEDFYLKGSKKRVKEGKKVKNSFNNCNGFCKNGKENENKANGTSDLQGLELKENYETQDRTEKGFNKDETIHDYKHEVYIKHHNLYEKREFEFRMNYYKKRNQKNGYPGLNEEHFLYEENEQIFNENIIRIKKNFMNENF